MIMGRSRTLELLMAGVGGVGPTCQCGFRSIGGDPLAPRKGARSESRESGFRFTTLSFTQKEYLLGFAGRQRSRRSPSGGSE
jgi:hypothetical protein